MPGTTVLDIAPQEQAQMLAALRRARYGDPLALHVIRLRAAGRNPTEIAAFLFCSRTSVYRIVHLYHAGALGFSVAPDGQVAAPVRTTILRPWLRRSLGALLKAAPRAYGWCRTRWSCATLAVELKTQQRIEVSAWTVRRWLHEMDWVGKRAKLVAKDDAPHRIIPATASPGVMTSCGRVGSAQRQQYRQDHLPPDHPSLYRPTADRRAPLLQC
jgi:transposase